MSGRYRINVVAEITGIPAPTLRAWERRYGVPNPERTDSAYRLYSEEDVALVKRMRDLTASGLAPAEAARQLRGDANAPAEAEPVPVSDASEVVPQLIAAARAFDVDRVDGLVRRVLFSGSIDQALDTVVIPAQRIIGDLWHAGEIGIAQEHLLSSALEGLCRELLVLRQTGQSGTALLACAEAETHSLPLWIGAHRLSAAGYRPVVLPSPTPPDALARARDLLNPSVVGISATMPLPAARIAAYGQALSGAVWILGGAAARVQRELVIAAGGRPYTGTEDLRALLANGGARRG